jgi:peptidoglycan/xylan/chitin deacetylase (PgdA/CDA1 family)
MAGDLVNGWYILLYHDVSWEETPFTRHVSATCPPDVFRDHVRACEQLGELVSVHEGIKRLQNGDPTSALFSFWFDDGFAGVRRYAAPILAERGMTGAVSVCSRFARRREMFWRGKLSYLCSIDAARHLRTRLREYGYSRREAVGEFVISHFGHDILSVINALYDEVLSHAAQNDAFRIFESCDGLIELHKRGWLIANHSAAHYPVGTRDTMIEEFRECDEFIQSITGAPSSYWVTPFGERTDPTVTAQNQHGKNVVLVDDRLNVRAGFEQSHTLYRICAPANDRHQLWHTLVSASRRSSQSALRRAVHEPPVSRSDASPSNIVSLSTRGS